LNLSHLNDKITIIRNQRSQYLQGTLRTTNGQWIERSVKNYLPLFYGLNEPGLSRIFGTFFKLKTRIGRAESRKLKATW